MGTSLELGALSKKRFQTDTTGAIEGHFATNTEDLEQGISEVQKALDTCETIAKLHSSRVCCTRGPLELWRRSEASYKSCCNEETWKATQQDDLVTVVAKHTSKLEAVPSIVVILDGASSTPKSRLGALSQKQLSGRTFGLLSSTRPTSRFKLSKTGVFTRRCGYIFRIKQLIVVSRVSVWWCHQQL